jgi:O-antigen/teichoic acid export membrane protein
MAGPSWSIFCEGWRQAGMDIKAAESATTPLESTALTPPTPPNPVDDLSAAAGIPVGTPATDEKRAGNALLWKAAQLGTSKVVYLLGTLILGRLLTPNDFGLVAIATVAITTVMTATETGMTNALVQATTREREHYDVAWTIGLLRGTLVCAVLCIAAPYVAELFGDPRATSLVRMMAFLPLLNSINSPRMTDLMRELKFSRLAIVAILAVVVEVGFSISLAGRLGGAAIILGKLAGALTTMVASYFVAPYRPRFRPNYGSARQLIEFGRWLFAIGLIAVTVDFFTKVVVARQLSVAGLGLFSLADRLAETPTQMANESIGAVAFPLYARLKADSARLQMAVQGHFIGLMFLLLPATGLIIGLSLPLEQRVLGPAWVGASPVIVVLALGLACEVSFNVVYFLLQSLGWGRRLFAAELTQYIVLISSVALLTGPYGLMGIGAARIITAIVVSFAGVKAAPPMFGTILRRTFPTAVAIVILSSLAGALAWSGASLVPGTVGVAVGLVVGGLGYFLAVLLLDQPLKLGIRPALALFFPVLAKG